VTPSRGGRPTKQDNDKVVKGMIGLAVSEELLVQCKKALDENRMLRLNSRGDLAYAKTQRNAIILGTSFPRFCSFLQ
jgi:hypothetical protein